jgi:hypothetical protein
MICAVFVALVITGSALAQEHNPGTSVVSFTQDFPGSDPPHYSITVDATGHATYECTGKVQESSEAAAYRSEFNLSAASREKIFEWTRQAKYFSSKIDSGNKKLAFTGQKILRYQDGQRAFSAQYNYSNLEPARLLTELFQNMASTLDYGRRLAYDHRYQKLALDEELKHMEAQAKNNSLIEIQGLSPILQEIVDDQSVMNVVRARAKALIQMGTEAANAR